VTDGQLLWPCCLGMFLSPMAFFWLVLTEETCPLCGGKILE
jgi:hypothetical protein